MSTRGGTLFKTVLPPASTATYDMANRMTQRTSAGVTINPAWDAAGELMSDGARTYGWDARGRLASISGVGSFQYDASDRRSLLTPTSGAAMAYLYDGKAIVQEQQGGSPSANLLNGAGPDEHLTRATTGTGAATSTFLPDALGSTAALATSAGIVATRYGYNPYGVASVAGTANNNPYQFGSGVQDGSGLILLRARYYNPRGGGLSPKIRSGLKPVSAATPMCSASPYMPICHTLIDAISALPLRRSLRGRQDFAPVRS